jgi:hypothetical protein
MSIAAAKLLSEFEALRLEDKQDFVREVIHKLPRWNSGPLSNDVAARAGDVMASVHGSEANALGSHTKQSTWRKDEI